MGRPKRLRTEKSTETGRIQPSFNLFGSAKKLGMPELASFSSKSMGSGGGLGTMLTSSFCGGTKCVGLDEQRDARASSTSTNFSTSAWGTAKMKPDACGS